jgi:hypothetical protein
MWSNCFIWAHHRERQLWRQWESLGCPQDRVPCIQRRAGRIEPYWTRHWVVGWWIHATHTLVEVESFVPLYPRTVPWYLAWTRLLFRGRVKHGDVPSRPPEEH